MRKIPFRVLAIFFLLGYTIVILVARIYVWMGGDIDLHLYGLTIHHIYYLLFTVPLAVILLWNSDRLEHTILTKRQKELPLQYRFASLFVFGVSFGMFMDEINVFWNLGNYHPINYWSPVPMLLEAAIGALIFGYIISSAEQS